MSDGLGVSVDEFQESLVRISNSSVVALDELWTVSDSSGDQVSLLDTIQDPQALDPAMEMDTTEMKDRLADAIARLPEREKLVVALYYYENLTLREIGEVLGVTESRVSQLHTKAVLRLKSRLQGDPLAEPRGGGARAMLAAPPPPPWRSRWRAGRRPWPSSAGGARDEEMDALLRAGAQAARGELRGDCVGARADGRRPQPARARGGRLLRRCSAGCCELTRRSSPGWRSNATSRSPSSRGPGGP